MNKFDKILKGNRYTKKEVFDEASTGKIEKAYLNIIESVGEDAEREGLLKTPSRAAKAMQYFTHGYGVDAEAVINGALFEDPSNEMVIVRDIEVYSLCEHHLVPFLGKAHVGYIPNGKIVGLSKIPRVIDVFARRLQVQEKLTKQVLNCLNKTLQPLGVGVVIECRHLCMMMRGVEKQNSFTTTSGFEGVFNESKTRAEFISLINRKAIG